MRDNIALVCQVLTALGVGVMAWAGWEQRRHRKESDRNGGHD